MSISTLRALAIFMAVLLAPSALMAQEAIEIGKILAEDDISIRDMSRIDQTVVVEDTLDGWAAEWRGGLNGAQAAYDNWSGGGVNTLSVTASTVFNLMYRRNAFSYAFATNLQYGQARLDGEETRKTNDRVAVNNKFNFQFANDHWSAFANINFSTQFDAGYNYGEDPPKLISNFFAPAYFTQIAGIAYSPANYFSAEAGLAMKETIVADDTLATRYGLESGDTFRFEPGYALALNFEKELFTNIRVISSVETFTNLQESFNNTDVYFNNEIVGEINDFMDMSFHFVMLYDRDYSREVQIKQILSAGVSVRIL